VGVATKDPELRKKFVGKPEHVVNFFTFLGEEIREMMAKLGFRTVEEMVGRVDRLEMEPAVDHWKAKGVDVSAILYKPKVDDSVAIRWATSQDHGISTALDYDLIKEAKGTFDSQKPVKIEKPIRNINRTVGAILSSEVSIKFGSKVLPP